MSVYKLHRHKTTQFECNIDLDGANLDDATARLVVESNDVTLLFQGSINEHGKCTISIPKLKRLVKEMESGVMRLEVIVEDTYFQPWSSPFQIDSSRKIVVSEVVQGKKPSKVSVVVADRSNRLVDQIVEELHSRGVTVHNIRNNHPAVLRCITENVRKSKKSINPKSLIPNVVRRLEFVSLLDRIT